MIKLTYDFSRIGLDGLTAAALWVHGWDRVDPADYKVPVYNEDEYDVDVQAAQGRPAEGVLAAGPLCPRGARGRPKAINDLRVIVNYEISAL